VVADLGQFEADVQSAVTGLVALSAAPWASEDAALVEAICDAAGRPGPHTSPTWGGASGAWRCADARCERATHSRKRTRASGPTWLAAEAEPFAVPPTFGSGPPIHFPPSSSHKAQKCGSPKVLLFLWLELWGLLRSSAFVGAGGQTRGTTRGRTLLRRNSECALHFFTKASSFSPRPARSGLAT
jgi:hypothetical protein